MKRTNFKTRKLLVLLLVFAMIVTAMPAVNLQAAAKKTVTVSTQKKLNAALKDKNVKTIEIKTKALKTFTIKEGDYAKIKFVVNAPNAKINNYGKLKSMVVKNVVKYMEYANGNNIRVEDNKLTLGIKKGASVKHLNMKAESGTSKVVVRGEVAKLSVSAEEQKLTISNHGAIDKINVHNSADIAMAGKSTETTKINTGAGAENVKLETSLPVDVSAKNSVDLILKEGAEKSSVTLLKDGINLSVSNNTTSSIFMIDKDGKKSEILAGETFNKETDTEDDTEKKEEDNKDQTTGGWWGGGSSSGSGSSGNNTSKPKIEITSISILVNGNSLTGTEVKAGDILTYKVLPANATGDVNWTVGSKKVNSDNYTVGVMDVGKTISITITGNGDYTGTKTGSCTVANELTFNIEEANVDKAPVLVEQNAVFYSMNGGVKEKIDIPSGASIVLAIAESDATIAENDKSDIANQIITNVSGSAVDIKNEKVLEKMTVKALNVDLKIVSEEDSSETAIHPVGKTMVTLCAEQLGIDPSDDLSQYHFVAKHTNVDNVEETSTGEIIVIDDTQYVRFTLNGLSTIWLGNIAPCTVTFDTLGGSEVAAQKVKFATCVNTTKIEPPTKDGYLFCGWDYDLAKTPIIHDITVTAKWIQGTTLPTSQYTLNTSNGVEAFFDVKCSDGKVEIVLKPGVTPSANLSYTVSIKPVDGAVTYVTSSDAKDAIDADSSRNQSVSSSDIQISGSITDGEGKVQPNTTKTYYKWMGVDGNIIKLQEISISVSEGADSVDTITRNKAVNRGVGTYEAYLVDTDGGENAKEPFVGYINGNLSGSYRDEYTLSTNVGFNSYRVDYNHSGYDAVKLVFSPFEGKTYSSENEIKVTAKIENGTNAPVVNNIKTSITTSGEIEIVVPLGDLGNDNPYFQNSNMIYLKTEIAIDNQTQLVQCRIQSNAASGNGTNVYTEDWSEVVSNLSGETPCNITYAGDEPVTITTVLTIPMDCVLQIQNADLTIGKGGSLILAAGKTDGAYLSSRKSIIIADGGVVTTVSQDPSQRMYYSASINTPNLVVESSGKIEVPEHGYLSIHGNESGISKGVLTLKEGSIVQNACNLMFSNFGEVNMDGTFNSSQYSYIYADKISVNGSIKQSSSDTLYWGNFELYGEVEIGESGNVVFEGGDKYQLNLEIRGAFSNHGNLQLSKAVDCIISNTGYSVYNSGTITLGENSSLNIPGVKLVNTGTITGSGKVCVDIGEDTTSYDTGIEYVRVDGDGGYWDEETGNYYYSVTDYSRYKYTHDPKESVDVVIYKGSLVNEGNGSCTVAIDEMNIPD